ncbi:Cleft lip and palate transmembrane like protein 1 [Monoraphidium neglectum]|uniref:Cleft lip and palate transmembrane like protein 1 n=1 Tax=Monoraphidium neglectum TaxID=145388 RepID=A0A0D2L9B7_9CHLO|nr:Cleft lip and palate transmembrane like protein 1 [Monoraphidium neglectum]KIZ03444.1 Cleft lip and palate transmembrane like protein 1 [Monoraphidium neglectum]|eukprot:XP_013902463.1 Cleft lip and palate transmembrane like protein 1 [Monoraphidium neglectum]
MSCYAAYSLMYDTHKSWYSWVLGSLVGAVYTFGFILMCPQLYLNYKLKSVAHLPWRQMTYKFLNTIIDDLFAFVIKMPTLHRLSVFRDDIIFLIFIYQRWIYRVDKTRVNEFGFSAEMEEERARAHANGTAAGAVAGGAGAATAALPAGEGEGAQQQEGEGGARRRKPAAAAAAAEAAGEGEAAAANGGESRKDL